MSEKEIKPTTYIYILKQPITGEVRYVGKADDPEERLKKHIWNCNQNNCHKNNWIRALKTKLLKPTLEIIEECEKTKWVEREKYWILFYKNKGANLVNSTDGGEGIINATKEVREKILKSLLGRTHTEETKTKMSKSAMGNRNGEGHSISIKQICMVSGKTIKIFKSMKEASIYINAPASFSRILKTNKKEYRGYKWDFVKK